MVFGDDLGKTRPAGPGPRGVEWGPRELNLPPGYDRGIERMNFGGPEERREINTQTRFGRRIQFNTCVSRATVRHSVCNYILQIRFKLL